MNSNKRNTSWFDDDFEVTYDDDIHSEFDFNTTKLPDNKPKKSPAKPSSKKVDLSIPDAVHQKNRYYTDNRYDNDTSDSIDSRKVSRRYQNEEPDYRDEEQPSRVKKQGRRRRRNSPARLAAPLQKGEMHFLIFPNLLYAIYPHS